MTEPPRPPGEGSSGGTPSDPTAPLPPAPGSSDPTAPLSPARDTAAGPPPAYPGTPPAGQPGPPPPISGAGAGAPPPGNYPPPGAYPPPGGYPAGGHPGGGYPPGPGGYGAPPPGYANADEKTWALIAHFGGILVGFIAPLVAYLAKGNESPTVRAHAVEALNFQITWGLAMIAAVILAVCSLGILSFLPLIVWVVVLVFSILAGIKANEGQLYRYPVTYRFIK